MGLVVTPDAQTEAALLEIVERFCSRSQRAMPTASCGSSREMPAS
jgi:hypothetical protein